jgi:outer membrane protein TolC
MSEHRRWSCSERGGYTSCAGIRCDALKAAATAERAAVVSLDLTTRQFQVGYIHYLVLLNADQTYQQAVIALAQAQANRYADTGARFQALGGG